MSRFAVRLGSLVLGTVLLAAPSADAGVIPWVYNSIFGYGPMYSGYGPAYPTYTAGYAPAAAGYSPYSSWGTGYSLGYAPNFSDGFVSPYSVGYAPAWGTYSTYYGGGLDGCGCNPCGCNSCGSLGCSNCSNGECGANYQPSGTEGTDPTPADKEKDLPKDDFEGKERPYSTIPQAKPGAPAWNGSTTPGAAGDAAGAAGAGNNLGTPGNFTTPRPAPGEPGSTIPPIDRPGFPGLGNPMPPDPGTGTPGLNETRNESLEPRIAGSRFELQRERVVLRTNLDRPVVARAPVAPERTSTPVIASK